jgi:DNA-binding CsgD family transcriptional regulator
MLVVMQPLDDSEQIRRFGRLIEDRHARSVGDMATNVDELEAIRERLAEVEQRLVALEDGNEPRSARGGLGRLTEAEHRIVALVVAGQTNDEVAEQLSLSPKTVEWSLTRVYRKLQVRSRVELATRLGFAPTPQRKARENPGAPLGPVEVEDESDGPLRFGRPRSDSQSADPEDGGET